MKNSQEGLTERYSRLTSRFAGFLVLAILAGTFLAFYNNFIIGFVVTFISKSWKLDATEVAWLIASTGAGIFVGAFIIGRLADMLGRKIAFMISVVFYSLFSILSAFVPEGFWQLLTILRFIIGLGIGGAFTITFPYVSEFSPTKVRGLITGISAVDVPAGTLLASLSSAYLEPIIGWQGLFLIGGIPLVLLPFIYLYMEESPRWLISKGKLLEARKAIAKMYGIKLDSISISEEEIKQYTKPKSSWQNIFKYPKSVITTWSVSFALQVVSYNFTVWGPSLLVLVLSINSKIASQLFVYVSISGLLGRLTYDLLLDRLGRKVVGLIVSFVSGTFLLLSGVYYSVVINGISLFYIFAIVGYFFLDALWPTLSVIGSEIWPQDLRSTGWGSGYGFGALGKIVGSIVIALVLGEGLLITPKPIPVAVTPIFIFFAAMMYLIFIVFLLVAFETKGKSLEEIERDLNK